MKKKIIVSGGFDPVHKWHVEYFQDAATYGDVIVALNSDAWLQKKKGKSFMEWSERAIVLREFRSVSEVIDFEDDAGGTACNAIKKVVAMYPDHAICFANGGDRVAGGDSQVSAEEILCNELGVENLYGVGKSGKIQSSSHLLADWKNFSEEA